jgi:hypothetical protein
MTLTLILIAFSAALVLVMLWAARGHHRRIRGPQELGGLTQPVDLAAFRNLVDPAEEAYLREHLSGRTFREVQRQRMRAALEYVRRTASNAAILLRLGEAARQDQDPAVAIAGRELVNSALRLRVNALLAIGVLYVRIALPGTRVSVGRVIEIYETLTEGVVRLTRLQDPAYTARISAVL